MHRKDSVRSPVSSLGRCLPFEVSAGAQGVHMALTPASSLWIFTTGPLSIACVVATPGPLHSPFCRGLKAGKGQAM